MFATSSQNFINIDKVECNFDDDITVSIEPRVRELKSRRFDTNNLSIQPQQLTVRVMPDKKLTFRGQLNITDFTESARYLRESTGHFTVSFEEIEFQFFYDTNDIYELDASVYHKKFSVSLHIPTSQITLLFALTQNVKISDRIRRNIQLARITSHEIGRQSVTANQIRATITN